MPAMLIELSVFTIRILYSLALLDVNTNAWMAFNLRYSEAEKHKCDICYGEGKFGFPVLFSNPSFAPISWCFFPLFPVCNRFFLIA